jgi:transposase
VIKVDQYQLIRELYVGEGLSKRAIARRLNLSRNTVEKYCNGEVLPWERKNRHRVKTIIVPKVEEFIRKCLNEDETAPKKQRHTAKRIYDRLVDEMGFTGGESTIRQYVREYKQKRAPVFIPLEFSPGEAAQVDWGLATVVMEKKKQEVSLFCMRLCSSAMPFVMAFPRQRSEMFLEGHQRGFEFFGGVPKRCIYDNLKTAVKEGWGHFVTQEQPEFVQLKAHYAFRSSFCNPQEAHEKGLVENLVGWIRRNVCVPVPNIHSWEELNQLLLNRCLAYQTHQIRGRLRSVGDDFAIEKSALHPLPRRAMDAIHQVTAEVNSFSTVNFERNRYSVPVDYAGKTVTVKATAFHIRIWYKNQEIAVHQRDYGYHQVHYELTHYLKLLEHRPRGVRNARPVREANLPDEFWIFADRLSGNREMVKVLSLISEYGVDQVVSAICQAVRSGATDSSFIRSYLSPSSTAGYEAVVPTIPVSSVDLTQYDQLFQGGTRDERNG